MFCFQDSSALQQFKWRWQLQWGEGESVNKSGNSICTEFIENFYAELTEEKRRPFKKETTESE